MKGFFDNFFLNLFFLNLFFFLFFNKKSIFITKNNLNSNNTNLIN
jgi:hypothetical protein